LEYDKHLQFVYYKIPYSMIFFPVIKEEYFSELSQHLHTEGTFLRLASLIICVHVWWCRVGVGFVFIVQ